MPDAPINGEEWAQPDEVAILTATSEDYTFQQAQLLPPSRKGRVWSLRSTTILQRFLSALGQTYFRVEQRAYQLFAESVASSTDEMIEDWEIFARLPGACDNNPPTALADRQQVLAAKLTSSPPPSRTYFLELAARMGYPNAELVSYHDPFLCTSPCNHSVQEWGGYWTNSVLLIAHSTGNNDTALECAVRDIWPNHGQIFFDFTTP